MCKERDPKGHYLRADNGTIANFTGVSSNYEVPLEPALRLDTASERVDESLERLMHLLLDHLQGGPTLIQG